MARPPPAVARRVISGYRYRSQLAGATFLLFSFLVALTIAAPLLAGQKLEMDPGSTWAGRVVLAVIVVMLLSFLLRRALAARAPSHLGQLNLAAQAPPEKADLVICCSGGGIKSASFAMGALERLREDKMLWKRVRMLYGVSGGGYMAATWAATSPPTGAPVRDGRALPGPTPAQVSRLRSRTDFIASQGRTRFDLVLSACLGFVVNLSVIAVVVTTWAWLVAKYTIATGLGKPTVHTAWWAFLPSLTLVFVAVGTFLVKRVNLGNRPQPGSCRLLLGRLYRWMFIGDARASDSDRVQFLENGPNVLISLCLLHALAVPLLIWVAGSPTILSDLWNTLTPDKAEIAALPGLLTVLVTALGLAHSGANSTSTPSSPWATAWMLVRRTIAPMFALLVIAGFVLWCAAILVRHEIDDPITLGQGIAAAGGILAVLFFSQLAYWANRTSIFPFYRDRLAHAYLAPVGKRNVDRTMGDLRNARPGLALIATANAQGGELPAGRNGVPFVLGRHVGYPSGFTGLTTCRIPAENYQLGALTQRTSGNWLTVAEAMAISGAAISPVAGRESKRLRPYRVLLALGNVRTGAWAPNPYPVRLRFDTVRWATMAHLNDWMDRPRPLHVVREGFGALRLDAPYLYITDGGHYDNLGLVVALAARPNVIYLLDGSGDPEDSFAAVGDAIATARMDLDVEVSFSPRLLVRGENKYPKRSWTVMRARFLDDGHTCRIVYIKALLTKDMSYDLQAFQRRNPGFPNSLDRLESLDEFDFEAYRQLGWSATDSALTHRAGQKS